MASEKKSRLASKSFLVTVIFGVLIAVALGGALYFFVQYQNSQAALNDPSKASAEQSQKVVDEVGKLIVLPQNEKPQIATVSDVEKLKEQSFFARAKNGDIVLIYTQAQKAVLYDPMQKKIVEVGPINMTEKTASVSPTAAPMRVALLNGTSVTGLSSTTEKELAAKLPSATVVSKGNARKSTYKKTIVVDLSNKNTVGASQLAQALNGEVGQLPAGELKPTNADILVILGQ